MTIYKSEKGQAMPGPVQPISPEDFEPTGRTELRWLGGGGIMLNCRGTVLMIDPVLEGFDMPRRPAWKSVNTNFQVRLL